MWDLTVPGNNDHDFYVLPAQASNGRNTDHVLAGTIAVLVHNCGNDAAQADLANMRQEMNMPAAGSQGDKDTLARLDMQGQDPLYGQNGRFARPIDYPGKGNSITKVSWDDHAEQMLS